MKRQSLFSVLNAPPTLRERLNPRYDCSIWQVVARVFRGAYRRRFYPDGPPWPRLSSVRLIKALRKCSAAEAEREQDALDHARRAAWLKGF